MAKHMHRHPIMPRETPTPMPIFLPLLPPRFAWSDGSGGVGLGIVGEEGVVGDEEVVRYEVVVVEAENGDVVLGTKFQPFRWIAPITVATCAVDIDVIHAEANTFDSVIVSYKMILTSCPAVMVDTHSLM